MDEVVSPALRGVLGHLAGYPTFRFSTTAFMGKFDNGTEKQINAVKIEKVGDDAHCLLADVEGDLVMFAGGVAAPLCSSNAATKDAVAAFQREAPLRWLLVI